MATSTSISIIACDDGIVKKLGHGFTIYLCVHWNQGLRGLSVLPLHIDGLDATSQACFMARSLSAQYGKPRAVLLDAITAAGFNIISPPSLARCVDAPIIIVYKRMPRIHRIRRAVMHLDDWTVRWRVLKILQQTRLVQTRKGPLYILVWGTSVNDAIEIIESLQSVARMPEPLRLANLFASALSAALIPGTV